VDPDIQKQNARTDQHYSGRMKISHGACGATSEALDAMISVNDTITKINMKPA
jgi:hypothetical protein